MVFSPGVLLSTRVEIGRSACVLPVLVPDRTGARERVRVGGVVAGIFAVSCPSRWPRGSLAGNLPSGKPRWSVTSTQYRPVSCAMTMTQTRQLGSYYLI